MLACEIRYEVLRENAGYDSGQLESRREEKGDDGNWRLGGGKRDAGDAHKHVLISYPIYLLWDVTRAFKVHP